MPGHFRHVFPYALYCDTGLSTSVDLSASIRVGARGEGHGEESPSSPCRTRFLLVGIYQTLWARESAAEFVAGRCSSWARHAIDCGAMLST